MAKPLSMDQLGELVECLRSVEDPRVWARCTHDLVDIIVIAVLGTLCGAEGIRDLHSFACSKETWLKRFIEMKNGVPSEDTLSRVLSLINPAQVETAFYEWVSRVSDGLATKTVSIDGKYTKGTDRTFNRGNKPLLVVSAFSHELGLTLAEAEGPRGSEYDGAMNCLEMLSLKNVLVCVDAGIGSSKIAKKIVSKGGDYLLPLKENRKHSNAEVDDKFLNEKLKAEYACLANEGHARGEVRHSLVLPTNKMSEHFFEQWPKAKVIIALIRERTSEDKRYVIQETGADGRQSYRLNKDSTRYSEEITYYVSSRKLSAKKAIIETRRHWGIENKLHWVLDVAFREDDCLIRAKTLAKNLSLIRKICLNLIRKSNTKGSVRGRIKQAGWSNDFLEQLIFC